MTSFGVTKVRRDSFMPTFKVIISYGPSFEKCNLTSNYFDIFTNSDQMSNCISALNEDDAVNYKVEFLNSLEPSCTPPHFLNLKVSSSIILLRNLNAPKLCNGTRLAVKRLMPNLIKGKILTGKAKGEFVLIPRIPLIPTDMPFEFKRLHSPCAYHSPHPSIRLKGKRSKYEV
ncbi:uncharacterized protein LOC111027069 [Myzus persicae]|uniref:uncharacterized protein LOC111027069 n=1 Tax=Myzus persicae TaxID=13164 RepID=UPI000B92FF57|nr:uncharacterized protein LOC111027069 [Myzus persicae]